MIWIVNPSCTSMQEKKIDHKVIILQSDNAQCNLLNESKEIIIKRLNCLNLKDFAVEQNDQKSQITITFNDSVEVDYLSKILVSRGKVNFLETFFKFEVGNFLSIGSGADCLPHTLSLLGVNLTAMNDSTAVFGSTEAKDTTSINSCLNSNQVKSVLPKSLRFIWSNYLAENNKLELFAVSENDNSMNETSIMEAKVSVEGSSNGVSITFKKDFWIPWEKMTRDNMNKSIAVIIDGKVYCAPRVRSSISGGRAMITGGYTEKEANMLAAIISCGKLPIDFRVK